MHVASICFKCFQVFHTYACDYFILMLHIFAIVFKCFSGIFASVLDACFKCFICLFFILQLLHLDVLKIDRVLHMGYTWEAAGGTDDVRGGMGRAARAHYLCALSLARRYTLVCSLCAAASIR
jgi:hypothetical protein